MGVIYLVIVEIELVVRMVIEQMNIKIEWRVMMESVMVRVMLAGECNMKYSLKSKKYTAIICNDSYNRVIAYCKCGNGSNDSSVSNGINIVSGNGRRQVKYGLFEFNNNK